MAISSIYTTLEQCDLAQINVGGVCYRCALWKNRADNTIEAEIWTEGEDAAKTSLLRAVVRTGADTVDCPRILGLIDDSGDGVFVAHWLEDDGESTATLHRARFDLDSIPAGWTYLGSISVYQTGQYDVDRIDGDESTFVLTYRVASGTVITRRPRGAYAWGSFVWTSSQAIALADTILAIGGANTTDNVVMIIAELTGGSAGQAHAYRFDLDTGGGVASAEVLDAIDGDNRFAAAAVEYCSTGSYFFSAEVLNTADETTGVGTPYYTFSRALVYQVGDDSLSMNDVHWLRNLHMASRPWSWSSGTTLGRAAFLWATFKSLADGGEFSQSYAYCLRFDIAELAAASTGTIRPIPVSAIMDGSVDARPHGEAPIASQLSFGQRLNHLPHVVRPPLHALGPDLKSCTTVLLHWTRLFLGGTSADENELLPAATKISLIPFYHEDPWAIRRDPDEPAQPDTPAWRGVAPSSVLPVEVPGSLLLAGGVTRTYDGQQLVELGFLWTPEIVAVSNTGVSGIVEAGTYWYTATFAWSDSKGQLHRGPPATPVSYTIGSETAIVLSIRPLNLTMKDDAVRYPTASPVMLEIWRTEGASGSPEANAAGNYLFRRVYAGPNAPHRLQDTPQSDPTVFVQTITDQQPNAVLQYLELFRHQLDPNTLSWVPLPPIPHVSLTLAALWQSRVFGYDRDRIRWSEQFARVGTQLVMSEFLDTNVFEVDDIGEVTALQPMDSALIVFTRDGIYAIVGDPGAGGAGATLALQVITRGTGCVEPRSVVLTPDGVLFQSAKGIYRITRGLSLDYPGAPIEDLILAAGNVRGAEIIEDRHKVNFVLQNTPYTGPLQVRPTIATFDYRVNKWATAALPFGAGVGSSRLNEMQHCVSWRGRSGEVLFVPLVQGACFVERADDDTVFADVDTAGTEPFAMLVETEWIHLSGVAGLKRITEIGIQAERLGAGTTVTIDAWYDTDGSYSEGAPDQTEPGLGADTDGYIRFRPDIQKMSGIRLRIYESNRPEIEGLRLVSLLIYYAAKGHPRRRALQT